MKNFALRVAALLSLILTNSFVFTQTGTSDASFNPLDNGLFGNSRGPNNNILASLFQSDGKIIVGGTFEQVNGTARKYIARLNADGSLDHSFVVGSGFNGVVTCLALQPDGKIIVGGNFGTYNGTTRVRLARLNTDGSIDNSFTTGTGFNAWVRTIAIDNNGKILVGGEFNTFNLQNLGCMVRLNENGTVDNTFNLGSGIGGVFIPMAWSICVQPNNKILVGGHFATVDGYSRNNIVRLQENGSIDLSFEVASGFDGLVRVIKNQSDEKILIGGAFSSYNGEPNNYLVRVLNNGSPDTPFNLNNSISYTLNGWVTDLEIDLNENIVIAGSFQQVNGQERKRIARILNDGNLDAAFNPMGGFDSDVDAIDIGNDGGIYSHGNFKFFNLYNRSFTALLNSDGSINVSYNAGAGPTNWFNPAVYALAVQNNGQIILGGDFTKYNGIPRYNLTRVNSNGSIDEGFGSDSGFNNVVRALAVQNDGKIIVGGVFSSYQGTSVGRIVRLNTDGAIDPTFNTGNAHVAFNGVVNTIAVQADGKIIVAGNFTQYNGNFNNRIIRLNADGTIDNTFNLGFGFNSEVWSLALQNDGKILVGGDFTQYNLNNRNRIVRLNADGSLDLTFNIGQGCNGIVRSLAIQNDGKIIAGGEFNSYNLISRNRIVRVMSDGAIDTDFQVGVGFSSIVRTVRIDSSGKIIVAGDFTSFNTLPRNRIIRLNSDATVDNSFDLGAGFDAPVHSMVIQANGNLIAGGEFISYNNTPRTRLMRINGDPTCVQVTGTDIISSCQPIVWIDGMTYSSSNNTATYLLQGASINGCDSLVTLNFSLWPCTELQAGSCDATGVTMDQTLRAINVSAPQYRFRIVGDNNGGAGWNGNTFILDRNSRDMKFAFVPGSLWGTTYTVDVAVGDGFGNYGPYGAACTVSLLGTIPTTQLVAANCNSINVDPTVNLLAVAVTSATGYRFQVNGPGVDPNTIVTKTMGGGAMRKLKMNEVASVMAGETYTVEIAIRDANGNWGAYGPACSISLSGIQQITVSDDIEMIQTRNLTAIEFGVSASHNPFTTEFGLQVLNANDTDLYSERETINVAIYDMSGKLIERHAINPMDIEVAQFGSNLASGMYMVEVKQGSNQAVVRQVKN